MKTKTISFSTLLTLLFFTITSYAQTDSTENKKPQLKLSINYNSNLNYYGRTDSLQSSGVFPMLEFWATPDFYINAAPIFVNNQLQSFDYAGTVTTIGYQHVSTKWLTHLYAMKPFYEESSRLVQSALKAQTGISISRLNNVVNITLGGDAKFSDQIDFGATASLDHIIRIQNKNNSVLVLDPSAYAYAGTQRFSRSYTKKKNNGLLLPPTQQRVTESVNQFNILAYEFSMPVIFAKSNWQLIATPSYILPQNLITAESRADVTEQGKNTFYATLGLKYTF